MKKLLLLGFILSVLSINVFAQERIITGRIFDENFIPLPGAQVYQTHSPFYNYSDKDGVFHMLVDEKLEKNLIIKRGGFTTQIIAIDSAKSNYIIKLEHTPKQIMSEINGVERETANSYYQNNKPSKKFSIDCNFMVDMMFTDFKSFEPLLGAENVDLLKQSGSNLVFELAFNYNRFSYGLSFGYDHNQDSTDMLNLNLYNYQYALRFGYNIIDSRYFRITPLVRLKWHIFDLHNSDKGDKIPLEQYLANKELDLKFNQLTGVVGCNLTYKTGVSYAGLGNIGVGIYGGYIFKLNDKPWVYSEEQHLTTANKIDLKKLDLGFYCMFYFDD